MPQDGLRSSSVYRSFVTCDDPKGVVDCAMIRKSKTIGSQKMEMIKKKSENRRKSHHPNTSMDDVTIPETSSEKFHSPPSYQLMEVSRGARNLNRTIDSWSKGMVRFDGHQPKDIAKDLLKGALNLQESLVMLGKLQEASHYMANLNKKQDCVADIQKPRRSADGSSRSDTEELKRVIRDSLVKQKLVEETAIDEKPYIFFPPRYVDSCSETPSTSCSSQSSMFHTTSESTVASGVRRKGKGPNLIAKLMGIEEYPSRSLQLQGNVKKELEEAESKISISSPQRAMFDIDRPKVRKTQTFGDQNVDYERRTLREVLETMRFKGLLKGNCVEEHKYDFRDSNHSNSMKRFTNDSSPPIVLIRPLHVTSLEMEDQRQPLVRGEKEKEEEAFYTKKVKKMRPKEEICLKPVQCEEGALKTEKMHRKPIKLDKEETKSNEKDPRKLHSSRSVDQKKQKREAIDKKVDKIQRVSAVSRNSVEKDTVKAKNVSKSRDHQDKSTSTMARKAEFGSNIMKSNNQIGGKSSASTKTVSKPLTKGSVSNVTERKRNHSKKEQPAKEPALLAKSLTKNVVREESEKRIDMDEKTDTSPPMICSIAAVADELPEEEENDAYGSESGGNCGNFQISLCDATPVSPKDTKTAEEEASERTIQSEKGVKPLESGENLGDFLLNNPSFLSLAEDHFDLNMNRVKITQPSLTTIYNFEHSSTKIYLDCAKELIECKSVRDFCKSRICISLDKLVQEICEGIENLRSYCKINGGERALADSLYAMLERDIMCKGVANGAWDFDWRSGFCSDEAEGVVNEIEKLVLDGLIDEVFV